MQPEMAQQEQAEDVVAYANSLNGSIRKYTDEAKTEYGLTVAGYAQRVRALAEGKSGAEIVLVDHVKAAAAELGADDAKGYKAALDWLKRIGFLLAGLAIAQGVNVWNQNPIERGSVVWLLALTGATVILIAVAFALDFPQVRRAVARISR